MISKSKLRLIRQLHQKKYRKQLQLFIAEGEKVVGELLSSDFEVQALFATDEWQNDKHSVEVERVTANELQSLSVLETANKVIAIARQPEAYTIDLTSGFNYLVLDGIRDPGNLGTMIRIADWFDFKAVICSEDCVEIYNPKVVQAAMGSLFKRTVTSTDIDGLLKKNKALPVYGAMLNGRSIYESRMDAGILVIGNESNGISASVQRLAQPVKIPAYGMHTTAESLNAAVACGVICAHMKQSQIKNPGLTGSD